MPKGKELTEFDKGQSNALFGEGVHKKEKARHLGRSSRVVRNSLVKGEEYGKRKTGGPKKLTTRDKRILREIENSTKGVRKLQSELAPEMSHMTVWRTVKSSPNIVRQKMNKRPNLSDQHKANRVTFTELKASFPLAW